MNRTQVQKIVLSGWSSPCVLHKTDGRMDFGTFIGAIETQSLAKSEFWIIYPFLRK